MIVCQLKIIQRWALWHKWSSCLGCRHSVSSSCSPCDPVSVNVPGRQQMMSTRLGCCHPHRRPGRSCWHLASVWSNLSCHWHWRRESVEGKFLLLLLPLPLSLCISSKSLFKFKCGNQIIKWKSVLPVIYFYDSNSQVWLLELLTCRAPIDTIWENEQTAVIYNKKSVMKVS